MNADDFRKLALAIADAVESSHVGHPDFRLHGKIFASLGYPDDSHGMVKLTPEQQATFMSDAPAVFSPCAGTWGRQGSTNVALAQATAALVQAALTAAAKNVDSKRNKR